LERMLMGGDGCNPCLKELLLGVRERKKRIVGVLGGGVLAL
jgi:hypothetical protein